MSMNRTLKLLAFCAGLVFFAPVWAQEGAKSLFYAQLDKPSGKLNTGVQYWIELHHKGQVFHVNNKSAFHSGDKIRFHVKSNIDGYAYVVLKEGSSGEQSVLFPDPAHNDETRIERGRDYSLPSEGLFTFDSHPGTERVTLLLSRTPMDAVAYLLKSTVEHTVVASAALGGSKDLVPAKIILAYEPASEEFKVRTEKSAATPQSQPAKQSMHAAHAKKPTNIRTVARKRGLNKKAPEASGKPDVGNAYSGVVTVVNRDPNGIIALDVTLDHQE